ncbi:MAG: ABC transporter ATP-binding protein [Kiritimatiellae bacterium]|nr:ABC transporter ATP-binding protein [Kiritimatiellia bacterium]
MAVLEVKDVSKSYRLPGQRRIPVLNGVSLSVEAGEHVAVIGRSGAGKTTLLNILGGLDKPTSGDVLVDGESLYRGFGASRRRNRIRASKVGFVFQSFHLMPELDIVENVMLPSMAGFVKVKSPRVRAKELLAKVGLADRFGHLPAELSGGEQQRVAIARALLCGPEIVFADEPTGNLDKLTGAETMKLLFEVSERPFALVMVTHSGETAALCDRVLALDAGRLVASGA